jgi:Asp-tRNA(Asn)/Glu-tRNA(Gln) amidotransferase C subunit
MVDTFKENADQTVNRDELISALEESRSKLESKGNTNELNRIDSSINELKAFQEQNLSPEMYKNIVGDLFKNFNQEQGNTLREILSEVGGLNQALEAGFGRLSGVLSDAFSPLMDLKEFAVGSFEILKGGFDKITSLFGLFSNKEEQEQTGLLERIKNYMGSLVDTQQQQLELDERQRKAQLRKDKTQEDGLFGGGMAEVFVGVISTALIGLGAAIGAGIRSITLPFEIIGKATNRFIPIAR